MIPADLRPVAHDTQDGIEATAEGLRSRISADQAQRASEVAELEAQRALAQTMFPREWAATLELPGEQRRRRQKGLRDRAEAERIMAPLRAAGECCGTCAHRRAMPGPIGRGVERRAICDLDSDSDGYAVVDLTDLCPRWASICNPTRAAEVAELARETAAALSMSPKVVEGDDA